MKIVAIVHSGEEPTAILRGIRGYPAALTIGRWSFSVCWLDENVR